MRHNLSIGDPFLVNFKVVNGSSLNWQQLMWRVSRRPDFVALLKLLSFTVVLFLFCYLLSLLCYVWTTLHYLIHSSIFRSAYPHWSRGWAVTHRWLWSSVNRGEHAGKQTFTLTFTPVENFESSINVWCIFAMREEKKKKTHASTKKRSKPQTGRPQRRFKTTTAEEWHGCADSSSHLLFSKSFCFCFSWSDIILKYMNLHILMF